MLKKECEIIRDLLPNYIEKLTSSETNDFVVKHLENCEECNKIFSDMNNVSTNNCDIKNNNEVEYLKKFNKKLNFLKMVLILIFAFFLVRTGRNTCILLDLTSKAKQFESSNCYYKKITIYDSEQLAFIELYNKGENGFCNMQNIKPNQNNSITEYKKNNKKNVYTVDENFKNVFLNSNSTFLEDFGTINYLNEISLQDFLGIILTSNIKSKVCNGKECYYIPEFFSSYIDKKTGLIVRNTTAEIINANGDATDNIVDYKFSFDDFNDKIFEEPDVSDYKIIEENNNVEINANRDI